MAQLQEWWFYPWESWQKFAFLHANAEPDEELIPSECCSHWGFCHPQAVFQQRSVSAGLGEFLPCPGSWLSHFQWSQMAQLQEWWFYPWESWQKFAFLHANAEPDEELIPSECCSHWGFCHPQAASQQRSVSAGLVGFLPCPGSWPLHFQWNQKALLPV